MNQDDDAEKKDVASVLRDGAFERIVHVCNLAESYLFSLREAAWRGDELTMTVHMRQLRLCVVEIISTYKKFMEGKGGGEAERGSNLGRGDDVA